MSHGFAGGQQSPFSPSSSPSWSFQASHPSFGAQTGSPFRPASSGPFFPTATSTFGAPSSGGSLFSSFAGGGTLFPAQSSGGGLFAQQQQPSQGGLFPQQQPWPATSGGLFPQQQQQQSGFRFTGWNTASSQQQPPPERNAFREEFYRVVARKDKRPVTVYTKVEELEENGQRAIRMIHDEQEKYRKIREEIFKEPWFRPETRTAELEKEFKESVSSFRKSMKSHGLDVDSFARDLQKVRPRSSTIDEALRDADHIVSEMDKLMKPHSGQAQRLYSSELQYQREFCIPHPFTVRLAKELEARLKSVLERVTDLEKNKVRGESERSGIASGEDTFAAFELVRRLSAKVADATDRTSQKVEMRKETYLTDMRHREGSAVSDPFEEAAREQRIRENEIYYDLRQKRAVVLQPSMGGAAAGSIGPQGTSQSPLNPSAAATSTPLLTFAPSSGSLFGPSATSGSLFGNMTGGSSGPLFGPSPWAGSGGATGFSFCPGRPQQQQSSTTSLFGPSTSAFQSSGGGLFGTAAQSSGGFGAFGASSGGSVSPQPQFGRAGFGTSGTVGAGAFSSPGHFGARNTGNRSL